MKKILILPSFEHSIERLNRQERKQLAKSLHAFNDFIIAGKAPFGFRFKKIDYDKYEFRVNIKLRLIVKEADDAFYLVLAGSHDEVKRYLKNFR
jgi:mRNA-degrading endonuclease RelE of RelBE toxin-antitoxin system